MNTTTNVVIMYLLFAISLIIGGAGILRRFEFWFSGKEAPEFLGNWTTRFVDMWNWVMLQRGVVREKRAGVAHALIYYGFLVLTFATTMVLIDNDFGIRIYQGDFYLGITVLSDVLGFGAIIGCILLLHRRYIEKPDQLHSQKADSTMMLLLLLMLVQGFAIEALRIHATNDPWALYSPIGWILSLGLWPLSESATRATHFITWWFHAITVFIFFAILPYTKFFHIISSPANLFFRKGNRPAGALPFPGDIEKLVEKGEEFSLGLGSIKDYSWKHLLELDACTSCGRCQDACPAYNSGKPLSPKWLMLDTRNHALALNAHDKLGRSILPGFMKKLDRSLLLDFFFPASGINKKEDGYETGGSYRGKNTATHTTPLSIGSNAEAMIAGEVLDPNVFWSCNTCMACVEACPVGINHVDQIVENRRNMAVMRGEIPHEAQRTLKTLENLQNPYGDPAERIKWIGDLNVKILSPGEEVDYLYWVGCVSSFDPRKQKIARALVTLMEKAGISYGILGKAENCTGDPARRLGEENLYQTLAKMNIETLKSVKFKYLVANCPHCFNTIKNEYPQLGNLGEGRTPEIIHHSKLLKQLIDENKLELKEGSNVSTTFHDPCYLGRYNNEYEAPREVIQKSSKLKIIEMEQSRNKGMCCGAGGGHFWMDLKLGDRVNAIRADQAAATGATRIATGCPFCMQMMDDGLKHTNREEKMHVMDIAEVLLEQVK